jgi:hypothetical protein
MSHLSGLCSFQGVVEYSDFPPNASQFRKLDVGLVVLRVCCVETLLLAEGNFTVELSLLPGIGEELPDGLDDGTLA